MPHCLIDGSFITIVSNVPLLSHSLSSQTAILLLRIDDIVSGHKKKGEEKMGGGQGAE